MAPTETPSSLESDARSMAETLERRRYVVLLLLTVVYTLGAVLQARGKPLWYDEIITTFAARAPDAAGTWAAAQASDINPPLPHLLIHYTMQWVANPEIGARIPSIVGFWIYSLCLYRFTRRRVGIWYALAALLLPVVTSAYGFAVEARAYGPVLAFCGIALVGWQAADGLRKPLALAALAGGLAGALLCHYYAILIYLPLAGGEAFRWYRRRRLDWPVWAAFVAGGLPLVWRAMKIMGVSRWSAHSWAPPYPGQVMEFWEEGLQRSLSYLVLLTGLLALAIVASRKKAQTPPEDKVALADDELVAGVLFLAIPVAAVAGALLVTHMFTPRYALFALTGFAFLAPMVTAHLTGGRTLVGFLMTVSLLAGLGMVTIEMPAPQNPFAREPVLAKALETEPVVIPDGQLFLKAWQYAPEALKSKLLFVSDDDASVKYMGFDSIDAGLRVVRPFAAVQVVDYRDFYAPGKEFLVYQNTLRPGWVLAKVMADGGSAEVLSASGFRELLRVRFKR